MSPSLLEIRGLVRRFPVRRGVLQRTVGWVEAVAGVDLDVDQGTTVGLVGESGSGKTTLGRCTLLLDRPDDGVVRFEGQDLGTLSARELRAVRPRMQMVFQDPHGSLNPRMTVGEALGEPLAVHGRARVEELDGRVAEALRRVGLLPEHARRYPRDFSGGQRQRIAIARALMLDPRLLICDEPVSALDVSVQARILDLLRELRDERELAYLFISHDLAVVRHISDHVAVMYRGRLVERADVDTLFALPRHPYTTELMAAVPGTGASPEAAATGEPPADGCDYRHRCPRAGEPCVEAPPLSEVAPGHHVRCWLPRS
jgi:oligopeptide/dipeptide ABC transporter ATP-binding protein